VKKLKNGHTLLATTNNDFKWIFIWNIYNFRKIENIKKRKDSIPDFYLELPTSCKLKMMKWSNSEDILFVICFNRKEKKSYLVKYHFNQIEEANALQ